MYKYFFFDLDGTLTDPGIGITNSVMHALKKYNIEVADRSELFKFIGPPLKDSFMKYYGFTEEQGMEAIGYYREYFSTTGLFENTMYEGIPKILQTLKNAGKKLVITTSKPDAFTIRILKHFDLYQYFDFIGAATMDETRSHKWEVIAYTLESLGISEEEKKQVIMIGDRDQDMNGAKRNGLDAAGVLYGYGSREELADAGAKYLLESPEDIILQLLK